MRIMADKLDRFTKHARQVLQIAQEEAMRLNHNYVGTEHLLLGLAKEENGLASKVLREVGATPTEVVRQVEHMAPRNPRPPFGKPTLTPRTKRVIELAVEEARQMGHPYIGQNICCSAWCVRMKALRPRCCVVWREYGQNRQQTTRTILENQLQEKSTKKRESKTPLTDQLGFDLTARAEDGKLDPVIGREKEIERVIQILSRRTKNNPALIGEPGVGKTAIVEGLAQRIIDGDVPETLIDKRVLMLDVGSLVAGTMYRASSRTRRR
jgi:ATP-dependent Clp protease ATP-binding subunit ClpC